MPIQTANAIGHLSGKLIEAQIKKDLIESEEQNMSIDQFLDLSKLAGSKLEAASVEAKDRICQMIFLNFVVDTEKVVDFQMREPFATLLKHVMS